MGMEWDVFNDIDEIEFHPPSNIAKSENVASNSMPSIGVAIIGGGIFVAEEHLVGRIAPKELA
jgi:hypothetical protein